IAAPKRLPAQPDVPTLAEAGGPAGMEVDAWLALVAPHGTPPEGVRRINADVNKLLADPEVADQLQRFGFEAAPGPPQKSAGVIGADGKKSGERVRPTGATAD